MDPALKTTTLILSHTLVVREPNVTCPRHAVLPTVHVCKQSPIAAEVTGPLSKKYTHIHTLFCKNYTTQPSTILTVVVVRFQRVLIQLLLSKYVIKGWINFPPYLFSVHLTLGIQSACVQNCRLNTCYEHVKDVPLLLVLLFLRY